MDQSEALDTCLLVQLVLIPFILVAMAMGRLAMFCITLNFWILCAIILLQYSWPLPTITTPSVAATYGLTIANAALLFHEARIYYVQELPLAKIPSKKKGKLRVK